jgi:hypothetical protein
MKRNTIKYIQLEQRVKKPTGKIIHSEFGIKETIYVVKLYGGLLRFPESSLTHQNPDDERDWKLKQLLK